MKEPDCWRPEHLMVMTTPLNHTLIHSPSFIHPVIIYIQPYPHSLTKWWFTVRMWRFWEVDILTQVTQVISDEIGIQIHVSKCQVWCYFPTLEHLEDGTWITPMFKRRAKKEGLEKAGGCDRSSRRFKRGKTPGRQYECGHIEGTGDLSKAISKHS